MSYIALAVKIAELLKNVARHLEECDKTVSKNAEDSITNTKELYENLINKNGELVDTINEKMKSDNLSTEEMNSLLDALRELQDANLRLVKEYQEFSLKQTQAANEQIERRINKTIDVLAAVLTGGVSIPVKLAINSKKKKQLDVIDAEVIDAEVLKIEEPKE